MDETVDMLGMLDEQVKKTLAEQHSMFANNQRELREHRDRLFAKKGGVNDPRIAEMVSLLEKYPEILAASYAAVKNMALLHQQNEELMAADPGAAFEINKILKERRANASS
jgi:ectoine hydroxylase-related dioxygenase (phytanoyl-CoA dioxygenase family)